MTADAQEVKAALIEIAEYDGWTWERLEAAVRGARSTRLSRPVPTPLIATTTSASWRLQNDRRRTGSESRAD